MSKNSNRGFQGLSDLVSDTEDVSAVSFDKDGSQSSDSQESAFPLMDLAKYPTMAAPWSSVDAGETWVWGDFFLIFQKKPEPIIKALTGILGEKVEDWGLIYHYSMSVFYRRDRNPHGPSACPIMVIALE